MNALKAFKGHQVQGSSFFKKRVFFTEIIIDSNATVRNNPERSFVHFARFLLNGNILQNDRTMSQPR